VCQYMYDQAKGGISLQICTFSEAEIGSTISLINVAILLVNLCLVAMFYAGHSRT